MSSQCIVYPYKDTIAVIVINPKCNLTIEEQILKFVPEDVTASVVNLSEFSSLDRTFRDEWELGSENKPKINMPKARARWMSIIREKRDKELARLDLEYIKADEKGNTSQKQYIAQQKQVLRDIPATFNLESATTVDQLKALWPSEVPQ